VGYVVGDEALTDDILGDIGRRRLRVFSNNEPHDVMCL
jgi:hypothetical protein